MTKLFAAAALFAALSACSGPPPPPPTTVEPPKPVEPVTPPPATPTTPTTTPPPAADPAAALAEAETIFNTRCAACHGASGKGDGVAAASLNPKPRNYTDKEWQKSVDDTYLAKVILEGGAAVGKSPLMVPNADLKDKPEVLKALVAKVRTFGN